MVVIEGVWILKGAVGVLQLLEVMSKDSIVIVEVEIESRLRGQGVES